MTTMTTDGSVAWTSRVRRAEAAARGRVSIGFRESLFVCRSRLRATSLSVSRNAIARHTARNVKSAHVLTERQRITERPQNIYRQYEYRATVSRVGARLGLDGRVVCGDFFKTPRGG